MNNPKHTQAMTMARLEQLLDAYGASPRAWPASEREAAIALVETSEQARRMLDQAAALDAMLDAEPVLEPSASLRARVMGGLPAKPARWSDRLDRIAAWVWPFDGRWRPLATLAAAAMLGITVGAWMPNGSTDAGEGASSEDVLELVFADFEDVGEEP